MTVITTNAFSGPFSPNGSTTAFPFDFRAMSASELIVARSTASGIVPIIGGYTVSLTSTGGTVTFSSAPSAGDPIYILSNPSFLQQANFVNQGSWSPTAIDNVNDLAAARDIYLKNLIERSIRVPQIETLDTLLPAAGRVGKVLWGNYLSGALEMVPLQDLANHLSSLLSFTYTGIPGPGNDLATHYTPSGGNDNTAANAAAVTAGATTGILRLAAGSYHWDQLIIPPNCIVIGAGKGLTTIYQNSGRPVGTSIAKITGSRSGILGCTLVGNIATDTSEFNHAVECYATVATGSIHNVVVDVGFQDIRGDGMLIGIAPTAYAAGVRLWNVRAQIEGDNYFRNGFSITAGHSIEVDHGYLTRGGLYSWDIETDAGNGPVEDVKIQGPCAGYIGIIGTDAADYVAGIDAGHLDLDPAHQTTSVPPYPVDRSANVGGADAILVRNVKHWGYRSLKANGFNGQAIQQVYNGGELAEQRWYPGPTTLTNICLTESTYHAFIVGAPGVTKIATCPSLIATATLATHIILLGIYDSEIHDFCPSGPVSAWKAANDCARTRIVGLKQTNGYAALGSPGYKIYGGSFSGDTLFSFCDDARTYDVDVTASTINSGGSGVALYGGSIGGVRNILSNYNAATLVVSIDGASVLTAGYVVASVYHKGYLYDNAGHQVVGVQQPAIADAVGSAGSVPTGLEFNSHASTLQAITLALRTHGLTA